ncbi:MAG: hypothetical protein HDQ88_12195 [Clostridia bacterium]|nr:hypothetical protein [Clostridia bacterium]
MQNIFDFAEGKFVKTIKRPMYAAFEVIDGRCFMTFEFNHFTKVANKISTPEGPEDNTTLKFDLGECGNPGVMALRHAHTVLCLASSHLKDMLEKLGDDAPSRIEESLDVTAMDNDSDIRIIAEVGPSVRPEHVRNALKENIEGDIAFIAQVRRDLMDILERIA